MELAVVIGQVVSTVKCPGANFERLLLVDFVDAQGKPASGQLKVNDKDVNWRVRKTDAGLLLNLVAARPLRGEWKGEEADGRWRLEIHLHEQ